MDIRPSNGFERLFGERGVLLADGAIGTNLFAAGLQTGDAPELRNVDRPERVEALHRSFVVAGADIILSNSFGGTRTRFRLVLHETGHRVAELNEAAVAANARRGGEPGAERIPDRRRTARRVGERRCGSSARAAAARFELGTATAVRWVRRWRARGSLEPRPRPPRRSALDEHAAWLAELRETSRSSAARAWSIGSPRRRAFGCTRRRCGTGYSATASRKKHRARPPCAPLKRRNDRAYSERAVVTSRRVSGGPDPVKKPGSGAHAAQLVVTSSGDPV